MHGPKQLMVFRVQDVYGRGPFRPGFSRKWADEEFASGMEALPTWMEEFGSDLIDREGRPGEHYGSAVRDYAGIRKWFSFIERGKLNSLGFHFVGMWVDRVLAESPHQLVFARKLPLTKGLVIIPWEAIDFALVSETRS